MKPAFTLGLISVLLAAMPFSALAQEHVDVPLPPYDPPPTASHRRDNQNDQPAPVPPKSHTQKRTSASQKRTPGSRKRPPAVKARTKSTSAHPHGHHSHPRKKHHRRFHWHWPWQHSK